MYYGCCSARLFFYHAEIEFFKLPIGDKKERQMFFFYVLMKD